MTLLISNLIANNNKRTINNSVYIGSTFLLMKQKQKAVANMLFI